MQLLTCPLCHSRKPDTDCVEGICNPCRGRHWLPPPTPPIRRPAPCSRCNGTVHIRCRALRERGTVVSGGGNSFVGAQSVDVDYYLGFLAATYGVTMEAGGFFDKSTGPNPFQPIGVIEAYICRNCGFTELYTRDAGAIPIGPAFATELIDSMPPGEGPYR